MDPTPDESDWVLRQLYRFHPLAVEDAISDFHVPKVDDYGNYLYLVFHSIVLGDERMDVHTDEVDVFLGANYLITLHDQPRTSIDKLWTPEQHQQNGLSRGPAFLLYELLDRQIDTYTPLIDRFEEQLELLGDQIFRSQPKRGEEERILNDILTAKSSALRLTRILTPQRELLYKLSHNNCSIIPAETRIYFQDAYDHLARLSDLATSMRDLSGSTIETHFALVNNRINETMKVLTMISTIFIPLSFIAGIYGIPFLPSAEAWSTSSVAAAGCERQEDSLLVPTVSVGMQTGRSASTALLRSHPGTVVHQWRLRYSPILPESPGYVDPHLEWGCRPE
jgi:magnesium transporter